MLTLARVPAHRPANILQHISYQIGIQYPLYVQEENRHYTGSIAQTDNSLMIVKANCLKFIVEQ